MNLNVGRTQRCGWVLPARHFRGTRLRSTSVRLHVFSAVVALQLGAAVVMHSSALADDASADSCRSPDAKKLFDQAVASKVHGTAGLGCDVRLIPNCLRLRCTEAPDSAELSVLGKHPSKQQLAFAHGELTFAFARGDHVQAKLDYAHAEQPYGVRVLELIWPANAEQAPQWLGRMRRVDTLFTRELQRSCKDILSSQLASATQGLTAEERKSLPLGWDVCQPGPTGAWMAFLDHVQRADCPGCLELDYNAWIVQGEAASGENRGEHHVTVLPAATKLQVTASDFDDDGFEELFLGFDVARGPQPEAQPCLWTQHGEYGVPGVAPSNPPWTCKRARDEDKDGRLDLVSYGPFVAALASDCGAKQCPGRITGPELVGHNLGGSFSFNDAVAQSARRAACPNDTLLLSARASDVLDTSKRVACAKLQGVASDTIVNALEAHRSELCTREACPVFQTLLSWATAQLPATLSR